MASPGIQSVRLPNSQVSESVDTFGANSTPGYPNAACEQVAIAGGPGFVPSAIIVPSGVRAAILGVGLAFNNAVGVNASLTLQLTRAGNPHLGTGDDPLGTFVPVLPASFILAGQGPLTVPAAHPPGISLMSAEGDGVNPLWGVASTLPLANTATVSVFYWLFSASDISAC